MIKEFSCRFDGRMDRQPFIIILIFVIFFVLWDFSAYVSLSYIIYYITIRGAPRPTCLLKNKKSQTVTPWINSHCYGIMHIRRSGGMQHLSLYINNTTKNHCVRQPVPTPAQQYFPLTPLQPPVPVPVPASNFNLTNADITYYVKKTRSHGLYTSKRSPGGLAVVRARGAWRREGRREARADSGR